MRIMRLAIACGVVILVVGCGMLPSTGQGLHAQRAGRSAGACQDGSCPCQQGPPPMARLHEYPPAADRNSHRVAMTAAQLSTASGRPLAAGQAAAVDGYLPE